MKTLFKNILDNGELPTLKTTVDLDKSVIVEGAATIGIFLVICVLLVLIYKTSKK